MTGRIFAVVTVADVSDLVNDTGQAVVDNARHSLDGTKIILDFNHHRATIDGLFIEGTDVDAVIAGCQMLTHNEALALMDTAAWSAPEEEHLGG